MTRKGRDFLASSSIPHYVGFHELAPVTDEETEAQQKQSYHCPETSEARFECKLSSFHTLSPTFHMTQPFSHTGRKFVSALFILIVAMPDSSVCLIFGGERRP